MRSGVNKNVLKILKCLQTIFFLANYFLQRQEIRKIICKKETQTDKECKDTSNSEDEQLEPGFPEGIVIADTMSMPLENKDGQEGMKLRRRSQIKVILK